jgi:16S rRNA (guanine(966)-N(2))-methyltransferase RsmD
MRIITGIYKGRTLQTVRDNSVRPATDRVKGTIFNVLQNRLDLNGARVLDLFAGSGSLGFEALSRGAAHVTFVDLQRSALAMIERNAEALGCIEECDIFEDDAHSFLRRAPAPFDLIFADPPYAWEGIGMLPSDILAAGLLRKQGFLIIEHSKQAAFAPGGSYEVAVCKEFGNTRVSFIVQPA